MIKCINVNHCKNTSNIDDLINHLNMQYDEMTQQCIQCGHTTRSEEDFIIHIMTKHENTKTDGLKRKKWEKFLVTG